MWPGSGTARVRYGDPGGVSLVESKIITARQHSTGFLNAGTCEIFPPLIAAARRGEHATQRSEAINAFMNHENLGGVDFSLIKEWSYESQVLVSPATLDPTLAHRVALLDISISDNASNVVYAEDRYLTVYPMNTTLDVGSPVLQVDMTGLVRSRKGLSIVRDWRAAPEKLVDGTFMHCSMLDDSVVSTETNGMLRSFDMTGQCVWSAQQLRGTLVGWSRVIPWDRQVVLWSNSHAIRAIDLRAPPEQSRAHILHFPDKLDEVHALVGAGLGQAFALTKYAVHWLCSGTQQALGSSILSMDHPLATGDYSVCMSHMESEGTHTVTITSQLMPMTTCMQFGRESGLPVARDDAIYVDTWPTIIPQSHVAAPIATGLRLYSVGAEGGLYEQQWKTAGDNAVDDVIDVPPLETARDTRRDVPKDFLLKKINQPFDLYNFTSYHQLAFAPAPHPADAGPGKFNLLGFANKQAFREYCEKMWVTARPRHSAEYQTCVDNIVEDMASATDGFDTSVEPLDVSWVGRDVKDIIDQWSTELELPSEFASSQTMSDTLLSQSMSQPMSQSMQPILTQPMLTQPILSERTLSQPALSQRKKRKKHKKA